MESQAVLEDAIRALQIQLDEGVDEWIMLAPQSRYEEAALAKAAKSEAIPRAPVQDHVPAAAKVDAPVQPTKPKAAPEFNTLGSDDAVVSALYEALPQGLQNVVREALPPLGEAHADLVVISDPPHRDAVAKGDLLGDAETRLLRKSLQAIDVDIDASLGHEPRAQMRILPISPWRMPQDRKFTEGEAALFKSALKARVALGGHRAILLAGSNLAGLEEDIEDGKLFNLPVYPLVSPHAMLREPMLKRVHWQRLVALHAKLDEIVTL